MIPLVVGFNWGLWNARSKLSTQTDRLLKIWFERGATTLTVYANMKILAQHRDDFMAFFRRHKEYTHIASRNFVCEVQNWAGGNIPPDIKADSI